MVHLIFKALLYISYFSIGVPFYFLLRKKYILKFQQYRSLGILFSVCLISDLVGYILIKNNISNHFTNNIYFIVSFGVISFMYACLLPGVKLAIYSVYAATVCLFFWDTFCVQSIFGVQSYVVTLCSVLSLGYSITYYDYLLEITPSVTITRYPFFWINTAIAYYFGLNLFLFIFSTYIFGNLKDEEIISVWIFHNLNNVVKNVLFAIGLSRAHDKNIEV